MPRSFLAQVANPVVHDDRLRLDPGAFQEEEPAVGQAVKGSVRSVVDKVLLGERQQLRSNGGGDHESERAYAQDCGQAEFLKKALRHLHDGLPPTEGKIVGDWGRDLEQVHGADLASRPKLSKERPFVKRESCAGPTIFEKLRPTKGPGKCGELAFEWIGQGRTRVAA